MKESISITIPMEYHALTRASDFLHGLAKDAKVAGMQDDVPSPARPDEKPASADSAVEPEHIEPEYVQTEPERDPSAAFGGGATPAPTATEQDTARPAETITPPAATATEQDTAPSAMEAAETGLDIDADGLPWDARIHSSSKKKLAKTQQWKKRRKPPEQAENQWQAYVESVEAELRRVMQAGPHAPIETREQNNEGDTIGGDTAQHPNTPATPPPAPAPAPAPTSEPAPAPRPEAQVEIKTLPELFRYITDNNVSDDRALAAVRAQGIESFALLGARPDLVPAVAKALQEG